MKVIYDPSKITYGKLLEIFFTVHDPTTLNRQGPDAGTSYRSAVFTTTDEQVRIAKAYIAQLDAAHAYPHRIVTEVTPNKGFYDADPTIRITPPKPQRGLHPDLRPPQNRNPQKGLP